jgi:uncharacterized protein DUF5818
MEKIGLSVAALFVLASFALAAPRSKTFTGEIMDNMCAAAGSHKGMEDMFHIGDDPKKCTLECVAKGGKFVLYNAETKTIYQLDDQNKPKEFAGQKVKVTGTYNTKTETLHVERIAPAS